MRWIKERVEALVQLRCIEVNGHWDAFIASVADQMKTVALASGCRPRLQAQSPAALPTLAEPSPVGAQPEVADATEFAEAA